MEFSVGDSVEAVDQLGIWTKAKVVCLVHTKFPSAIEAMIAVCLLSPLFE